MPRRNRVDPFGDLHAVPERGLFTGNRGCVVDDHEQVVRHHRGRLWITCLTSFRGRRVELARPGRWTPLFFLDEAVALAAGHRPCGECRRDAYRSYQAAVTAALGRTGPLGATELNDRLHEQRLRPGRSPAIDRRGNRVRWRADVTELPAGAVIVLDNEAHLVNGRDVQRFSFAGWEARRPAPAGDVDVLTPGLSVQAMRHGYQPVLHPSAT